MPSPLYADVALCGVIFIVGGNIFIKKLIELDSKKTLQLILITFIKLAFRMGRKDSYISNLEKLIFRLFKWEI